MSNVRLYTCYNNNIINYLKAKNYSTYLHTYYYINTLIANFLQQQEFRKLHRHIYVGICRV